MKNVLKQMGKAICYLLAFVGFQLIVSLVGSMVYSFGIGVSLGIQNPDMSSAEMTELLTQKIMEFATNSDALVLLATLSDVLCILFLFLFFLIRKKKFTYEAGINKFDNELIPFLIVLGVGLAFVVTGVLSFLPESVMEEYSEAASILERTPSVLSILAEAVLVPICEEVTFRGLVFSRLKKAMPVWVAILVSSAMFGIVHGTNPVWFGYAFTLGMVFAFTTYVTGSIIPNIMLHMIFNLLGGFGIPAFGEYIPDVAFYIIMIVSFVAVVFILVKFFRIVSERNRVVDSVESYTQA